MGVMIFWVIFIYSLMSLARTACEVLVALTFIHAMRGGWSH
jgi:hypothetical protein